MGGSGSLKEAECIAGDPGGHWRKEMQSRGSWEPWEESE